MLGDRFKKSVVELYLDGHIDFETLDEFVGRQNADGVRTSKQVLDQGEKIADELSE